MTTTWDTEADHKDAISILYEDVLLKGRMDLLHRAEGDLVFVHLSLFMAGINRNAGESSTNVDIFRVDQSGLMIEHWDVLQIQGEALPNSLTIF